MLILLYSKAAWKNIGVFWQLIGISLSTKDFFLSVMGEIIKLKILIQQKNKDLIFSISYDKVTSIILDIFYDKFIRAVYVAINYMTEIWKNKLALVIVFKN